MRFGVRIGSKTCWSFVMFIRPVWKSSHLCISCRHASAARKDGHASVRDKGLLDGISWDKIFCCPLNKCEAKSFATALAVARNRDCIFRCDVSRSFARPSDLASNKNTDQCGRRNSENHSIRKRKIGSMDRPIPPGTIQTQSGGVCFALLWQRRSG